MGHTALVSWVRSPTFRFTCIWHRSWCHGSCDSRCHTSRQIIHQMCSCCIGRWTAPFVQCRSQNSDLPAGFHWFFARWRFWPLWPDPIATFAFRSHTCFASVVCAWHFASWHQADFCVIFPSCNFQTLECRRWLLYSACCWSKTGIGCHCHVLGHDFAIQYAGTLGTPGQDCSWCYRYQHSLCTDATSRHLSSKIASDSTLSCSGQSHDGCLAFSTRRRQVWHSHHVAVTSPVDRLNHAGGQLSSHSAVSSLRLDPRLWRHSCSLDCGWETDPFWCHCGRLANVPWTTDQQPACCAGIVRGGAKTQQRYHQQAALATTLLEQGFELQWITKTTDVLLDKYSIARLQQITAQPPSPEKLQHLLSIIKEAHIDIPDVQKPATRKESPGMPWNPRKKRQDQPINPAEFQLVPNFFTNQDGTTVTQLYHVQPQTSGVCLLLPDQAAPFLKGDRLSTDEVAIVVLGSLPSTVVMPSQSVKFPCLNPDRQMVILSGTLFQMGAKDVRIQAGDPQQIKTDECTLLALTLHRQDWSQEEWLSLTNKPIPYLRTLFARNGFETAISSMWGKSLRHGKAPASPQNALSVQLHCSILNSRLTKFLTQSGFNHIYATPKCSNGRLDQQYKVIWLKEDEAEASVLAVKAPGCLGLVRGKSSLGLRFHQDSFEKAWETLNPGLPPPTSIDGDIVYKAEGLPFGTTSDTLRAWLQSMGWEAVPVRSLGPQSWLIRTASHPPQGIPMFNSCPILLRHLPARMTSNAPVVLGPKSSKTATTLPQMQGDPWASYKGPATVRSSEGPVEARLSQQDEKIERLQKSLDKVAASHETFANATTQKFEQQAAREEANLQHVSKAMDVLKKELDQSMQQVAQQNAKVMDARLGELKQLLIKSSKRSLSPGDADMHQDSWLAREPVDSKNTGHCLLMPGSDLYSSQVYLGIAASCCIMILTFAMMLAQFSSHIFASLRICLLRGSSCRLRRQGPLGMSCRLILGLLFSILPLGSAVSVHPVDSALSHQFLSVDSYFEASSLLDFCLLHASRVGEADHPGPPDSRNSQCVIAISNPTSIVSKASTYEALIANHDIDVFTASETAATLPAQRKFGSTIRKSGFNTIWSPPVAEKISRTDGEMSLRGVASGVMVGSRFHVRHVPDTVPSDLYATCRLLHTVVTAHQLQFQLLVVYGLAASGTNNQNRTILQAAVSAAHQLPLPFMIAGDFNCDPHKILGDEFLQAHNLIDLPPLHVGLTGLSMPCTCKGVTRPDNAILSHELRQHVSAVSVLPDHHFDAHQVVLVTLQSVLADTPRFRMPMPAPWSDLVIDFSHFEHAYLRAVAKLGKPESIEQWGVAIEFAVDHAYRRTQMEQQGITWTLTKPLPHKYRGRCQPRFPKPAKPILLTKPARRSDYNPGEICRARTRDKIKQVRRVASLRRTLEKYQHQIMSPEHFYGAWCDWQAILRSKAMGPCFVQWCQDVPEIGPVPLNIPSLEFVHTLEQMLKFDADAAAAQDRQFISSMTSFHAHLDAKWSGNAKAYLHMKDNFVAPFDGITQTEHRDAVAVANDDLTFQIWCENPQPFSACHTVQVSDVPCAIVAKDDFRFRSNRMNQQTYRTKLCCWNNPLPFTNLPRYSISWESTGPLFGNDLQMRFQVNRTSNRHSPACQRFQHQPWTYAQMKCGLQP